MFAAGVITDLNLVYPNWPTMTRRILIGFLSGRNCAIRTTKMDDPQICFRVLNCFFKIVCTKANSLLLSKKFFLPFTLVDKLSLTTWKTYVNKWSRFDREKITAKNQFHNKVSITTSHRKDYFIKQMLYLVRFVLGNFGPVLFSTLVDFADVRAHKLLKNELDHHFPNNKDLIHS